MSSDTYRIFYTVLMSEDVTFHEPVDPDTAKSLWEQGIFEESQNQEDGDICYVYSVQRL